MTAPRFIGGALLAVLWTSPLRAQGTTGSVRGRITDAFTQQPLAGVTVAVGTRSALTQADGRYLITVVPAGSYTARARMIGYAEQTLPVTIGGGDTVVVDLALTGQAVGLSAVVVTGYGEQRVGDITGSVTSVTDSQFNTGRIVSPAQLIASKAPGVQVVDNNEPGGGLSIRIRGQTSVSASSEPLYVVDGMPVASGAGGGLSVGRDPLNSINPNDIESITVLRDASAAAIYGSNAASGVVLITTKTGRQGGMNVEYTANLSGSSVDRLPDMLNAAQFRTAVQTYAAFNVGQLGTATTDWFRLVDRTAFGQEHNLSASNRGATNSWYLSAGYLDQDGVMRGTTVDRVTLAANYRQSLFTDRMTLRANLRGSRQHDLFTPGGVLSNAAQMGPTQPMVDTASATGYYNWPGNTLASADNPLEILNLARDEATTYRSSGNLRAEYSVPRISGLRLNVNLGFDVTSAVRAQFRPNNIHDQIKGTAQFGTFNRYSPSQVNSVLETYLNYATPISGVPGTFDVTGGYSYSTQHAEFPYVQADSLTTNDLGLDGVPPSGFLRSSLFISDYKFVSFFGRAHYNLNDRYLAAVTLRRDASSRFGPENAWATFPSIALAWRISQASFLRGQDWLSDLKVRYSWAKTGNQAIGDYLWSSTYQTSSETACPQLGAQYVCTIRPSAVDRNIRWETTRSNNVGIDFGLWDQRLSGSLDYYVKHTDDLIFDVPVCGSCNLSNHVTTNIGSMKNNGVELGLNYSILEGTGRALGWNVALNVSHNTNELTQINPYADTLTPTRIRTGDIAGGVGNTIQVLEPGSPVNSFFTCRQYYDASGKPEENRYYTVKQNAAGDSTITGCVGDRRAAHDPAPKWILGLSSYMSAGNWDMSFTLRAHLGNYVYNNVASNLGTYIEVTRASPYNLHSSVLETGFMTPQYLSDYYVEDASFLRLDNLSIGYSATVRGQRVRFFATGQNLFTITGYSGVDPTAGLNGIDNNIYPRSRTFSTGFSLQLK
ncbi:MAG TPA: SusC/RagA family TonB-linked outer membrane protein [Gemmatimonadales bacterium]|jgi:iron complex outermembrane receptor protein|nr:SusC/RagA family TonB-linked outer membrane protein [Gemmatimonadales bacterium]